ncbi:MAG: C40 family peptidase [bacterium]|nr:C40 family peptidase [bacterium]
MIEQVLTLAKSLVGRPYKYGAKMEEAPAVFDCSGFIKYIFAQSGVDLPRSTIEQAREGREVKLAEVKPGDLIFMRGSYGHYNPHFPQGVGHVGIYTKDKTIIHAASKRLSEKPIIEEGQVLEMGLEEFLTGWQPVVVVKRLI